MNFLNRKKTGIICVVLGGVFFLAGLVLFILLNSVNMYAQKAEATILSTFRVDNVEEPYTFLELTYRVGDEMVVTTQSFSEEIPEDTITKDIYYNVKNPEELLDAGWNFMPLLIVALGTVIILPGLYYADILTFGIEPRKKPGKNADKWQRDYYKVCERLENGFIPLFGALAFLGFGIWMLFEKGGFVSWIPIAIAAVAIIYVLIDLIPAVSEYISLKKIGKSKNLIKKDKNKVKSVLVDDDFEKFEKEQEEKNKTKKE